MKGHDKEEKVPEEKVLQEKIPEEATSRNKERKQCCPPSHLHFYSRTIGRRDSVEDPSGVHEDAEDRKMQTQ